MVFPCGDSISEGLELPVNVKMGTVDIAKKGPQDFFRNLGVVPVEIKKLISTVFKESRPVSFTFSEVECRRPLRRAIGCERFPVWRRRQAR